MQILEQDLLFVCGVPLTTHVFAAMDACTAGNQEIPMLEGEWVDP